MTERRRAFYLFLLLDFVFMLTSTGRVRTMDEVMTIFQTESLVLRGTTAVPQAVPTGNYFGKYDRWGQPRPAPPPGHSVAAIPWYAAGHWLLARLPGVPAAAHDLMLGLAVTLSSATFAAAAAALAFWLFLAMGIELRAAFHGTLLLALATPLFAYSGWFYSEPLSCALFLGAAAAAFGRPAGEAVSPRAAALAGALLGAAVLVRPTHVLAAPLFLAAVLVRDGRPGVRAAVRLAMTLGVCVAVYLAYNFYLFGDPLEFGYPAFAEGKRVDKFDNPLWRGLYAFLLSPGKSVLLFAPPVLLALYALPRLWRRDRGLGLLAACVPLAYLLFYSKYSQFEGGYSYGPRYLLPAAVLLCLALGPVLEEARWRRIALVLFIAGALVQALGLSTSFLEAAVSGGYYNRTWDYQLGYSPLWEHAKLFLKYAASSEPARIGLGFDRWFLFLAKGGVATATIAALAGLMAAGAAVSGWRFAREMRRA